MREIIGVAPAEVVWLDADGVAQFDALHSRVMDHAAVACAFDLLMLDGDDLRRRPLSQRKAILRKVLRRTKGGTNTSSTSRAMVPRCSPPCAS